MATRRLLPHLSPPQISKSRHRASPCQQHFRASSGLWSPKNNCGPRRCYHNIHLTANPCFKALSFVTARGATKALNLDSSSSAIEGRPCKRSNANHIRSRAWTRSFAQSSGQPDDADKHSPPASAPPPKQPLRKRILSSTPHENIYTIPNLLTFSRLAAAPVLGYLVLHDAHAWTLALFLYAGATDLVDGWLARRLNQQTVVGSVVDPMADKALMMSTTIALAVKGSMPPYLAVLILGRDALLGVAAIYYRWISLPPPKTFARYWDFSLPSAEVRPTTISKYNTFFQLALIGATVALPMAHHVGWGGVQLLGLGLDDMLRGMQWGVATTTVWSGLSYVYNKDAVRILTPEEGIAMEKQQKGEQAAAEKEQKLQ